MEAADSPTVRIGVYVPYGAQLLDMACVDIFHMMSRKYLDLPGVPQPVAAAAPGVSIVYIGTVQPGEPIAMTADVSITCTHHLSDPAVQPGKLDIVLVPGPDPRLSLDDEVTAWLRAHGERADTTDVLSVCTGIYLVGGAGLLKGRTACGPRGLQSDIKEKFEGVTLLGDKLRWVQDGNLWSSGGITNGNDLVAAYARRSRHFPRAIAEFATMMAEIDDRQQQYEQGIAAFTIRRSEQ